MSPLLPCGNEFKRFFNESNIFFLKSNNLTRQIWKIFTSPEVWFHLISDPMFGSCFSCCGMGQCYLRQLLIINNSNFTWSAGLHLWSNYKSSTTTTTTTTTWTIHIYALVYWIHCGLLVLVSLVLCWKNMTAEYSCSPYKVGLINVGTTFA